MKTAFLDKHAARHLPLRLVRLLRSHLFIAIVSLLVLGGFTHEIWGRVVEHDHGVAAAMDGGRHQDSDSKQGAGSEDKGCNHQCCHHGYPMSLAGVGFGFLHYSLEVGALAPDSTWVPDAIPQGIEHPPQLA
jgi:hypothetical protein